MAYELLGIDQIRVSRDLWYRVYLKDSLRKTCYLMIASADEFSKLEPVVIPDTFNYVPKEPCFVEIKRDCLIIIDGQVILRREEYWPIDSDFIDFNSTPLELGTKVPSEPIWTFSGPRAKELMSCIQGLRVTTDSVKSLVRNPEVSRIVTVKASD